MSRVITIEPGLKSLDELFNCVKHIYLRKSFPRNDFDVVRHGPSLLLFEVTRHCILTTRNESWKAFLKKMSSDDPIVIYYIVEVLIAEENYIEALTQLALIIK